MYFSNLTEAYAKKREFYLTETMFNTPELKKKIHGLTALLLPQNFELTYSTALNPLLLIMVFLGLTTIYKGMHLFSSF